MPAAQQISTLHCYFHLETGDSKATQKRPRRHYDEVSGSFAPKAWVVTSLLSCGKWEDASHFATLPSPPATTQDAAASKGLSRGSKRAQIAGQTTQDFEQPIIIRLVLRMRLHGYTSRSSLNSRETVSIRRLQELAPIHNS